MRTIPFGYRMENGKYIIDKSESETVIQIFEHCINGLTVLKIVGKLSESNIEYTKDVLWNPNHICRILCNQIYIGSEKYPQIVTCEMFNKAVESRKSRDTKSKSESAEPINNRQLSACRKIIYCGNCGEKTVQKVRFTHKCPKCGLESRLNYKMLCSLIMNYHQEIAERRKAKINFSYEETAETLKADNESRMIIESQNHDFEYIKKCLYDTANAKYKAIKGSTQERISVKIDTLNSNCEPPENSVIKQFAANVERMEIDVNTINLIIKRGD